MDDQRGIGGAPSPQSPGSTLVSVTEVPARSARRATARRASDRRASARQHRDDAEGHIIEGRSPVEPDLYLSDDAFDAPPNELGRPVHESDQLTRAIDVLGDGGIGGADATR
jgi:hypothetical protein